MTASRWSRRKPEAGLAFNQPAGHLECGEALVNRRSGSAGRNRLPFPPHPSGGDSFRRHPTRDVTYLRSASVAIWWAGTDRPLMPVSLCIAHWLSLRTKSGAKWGDTAALVLRCVEDCSPDAPTRLNCSPS